MKAEFRAKFLNHLIAKKEDKGFTLIELLVVIIIIGILSAIALPSFLNQANKAKQSEAKQYVGSMNRAQQAYYLEQNQFANNANFGSLGLGIATQTTNYKYVINGGGTASPSAVTNQAQLVLKAAPLKAYIGAVQVGVITETSEATTLALLCEAAKAGVNGGDPGTEVGTFKAGGVPSCPATTYINLGSK